MDEQPKSQNWWQTLPGILTALAGIITAGTGFIVALSQSGVFHHAEQSLTSAPPEPTVTTPAAKSTQLPVTTDRQPAHEQEAAALGQKNPTKELQLPKRINLFAPENGAQVLVASSDAWTATIDGKEDWQQISDGLGKEAVYGFRDERPATFDTFTMLITETADSNVKEFELFIGNDSPTGAFASIGKFQTQNAKLFKTPYQEFTFPAVTAKYFKCKLLETYGFRHPIVHEFQLFGSLK